MHGTLARRRSWRRSEGEGGKAKGKRGRGDKVKVLTGVGEKGITGYSYHPYGRERYSVSGSLREIRGNSNNHNIMVISSVSLLSSITLNVD